MREDAPDAISIQNLSKVFGGNIGRSLQLLEEGKSKDEIQKITGDTVGVHDASFTVRPQETFIVMGLSGSGKSTLIRCVIRLIEPSSGQVRINDREVTAMGDNELRQLRRQELGMVFQQFALFPHRRVIDNVAYGLEVQGVSRKERHRRAEEILDMVGLAGWESYYPKSLSGGMQQRVGLARALAHDPNILLMDEPFSALDPLIRRDMQEELLQLQSKMNKAILFITHDLDEALQLGDRIAIMNEGEVVQIGTAKEIVLEPADDYVAEFVRDVDPLKILSAQDVVAAHIPILSVDTPLRRAWREMSEGETMHAVLADHQRRLRGLVLSHDVRAGLGDGEVTLDALPAHHPRTASPDMPAQKLLAKMQTDSYPVVLVGDDGVIEGAVDGSSLVAALRREWADDHRAENEMPAR